MAFLDELKSFNGGIYGQFGLGAGISAIVLGVLHIITFNLWGVLSLILGILLLFVEVNFILKICPTSDNFDKFIRSFTDYRLRTGLYVVFAVIFFLGTHFFMGILVIPGLLCTAAFICYLVGAIKKQDYASSRVLGGVGVSNV